MRGHGVGKFPCLAHVNHRTTDDDMTLVLSAVVEIGDELVANSRAAGPTSRGAL